MTNIDDFIGEIFPEDCPHCHTQKAAFTIRGGCEWRVSFDSQGVDLFGQCGNCRQGIVARFYLSMGQSLRMVLARKIRPDQVFPPHFFGAPPYTPNNVAHYFIQGKKSLGGNWDAAGAMFREALEVAMKEKFPDIPDTLNLFSRIKKAAEQHALTPDLAEWAHHIRIEGNKAVHKGPYQEKDARELEAFTDMVLRYLFTLPGMLEERKRQLLKAAT